MLIAVVNNSTLVQNSDLQTACQAIQIQMDQHLFPAWNMNKGTITFFDNKANVPADAWLISVIDNDLQVEGALGYHQEETDDKIDGFIMCQPILSNGGKVLAYDPSNPGEYTVSATLSHEVIETIGDVYTNTYYDNRLTGESWCGELADPVEQISYGIVVNGVNVSVSDFVLPNFFNPYAEAKDAPFNYLNTVKAPFTILPGGYAIVRNGGMGTESQIFGNAMPQWRKDMKASKFSRASKRIKTA